jgi:hypothetical protein
VFGQDQYHHGRQIKEKNRRKEHKKSLRENPGGFLSAVKYGAESALSAAAPVKGKIETVDSHIGNGHQREGDQHIGYRMLFDEHGGKDNG